METISNPEGSALGDVLRLVKAARRLAWGLTEWSAAPIQQACGLKTRELIVLRAFEGGSAFPKELMDRTDTAAAVVTRVVDRLVELGYVVREPDTVDRRRVAVTVTAAGAEASAAGWRALEAAVAEAFGHVPPDRLARIADDMEDLNERLTLVERPPAAGAGSGA